MRANRSARRTLLEGFVLAGLARVIQEGAQRFRSRVSLLTKDGVRAGERSGEGKGTRLELFSSGVLGLEPEIRELIRAA